MPLCFPLNRHMVCGSLPLRTPPVRACYALFLAGAVVVALPPRCIGQTDTTPAPTDSTTRPTHSYFIDAARLTREGAVRDVDELLMDPRPGPARRSGLRADGHGVANPDARCAI